MEGLIRGGGRRGDRWLEIVAAKDARRARVFRVDERLVKIVMATCWKSCNRWVQI